MSDSSSGSGGRQFVSGLGASMFGTPEMAAVFSDAARVRRMLEVEAALARAQAAVGILPAEAAEAIARACEDADIDAESLHREAAAAGTLAIPLVARLTDLVPEDARGWVHRGATSQDIVDTATVLQARDGLDALVEHVGALGDACAVHARRYRDTPMVARTLLQHAAPTTFGLTAARW
ncbi:MAG: lyase family protein, partial [Nitriliruptorales bacterium]